MGKRKKKGQQGGGSMKKIQLTIPVPDDRPNWPHYERHDVMMSVSMEFLPENFEKDYIAVICPVAKRRIVVSYMGWTCSYNKLTNMDRKFQSALPGGNVHSIQVIKSNDCCILDCLHLKAERTFYILDLMHWKQLPYYESEADFRFHWINQVESEMDLTSITSENEYKFKSLPRVPPTKESLYAALEKTTFKVDGVLFFYKRAEYVPGDSPSVLWLPPSDFEKVLGWKPPESMQVGKPEKEKAKPPAKSDLAKDSAASSSATEKPTDQKEAADTKEQETAEKSDKADVAPIAGNDEKSDGGDVTPAAGDSEKTEVKIPDGSGDVAAPVAPGASVSSETVDADNGGVWK